MSRKSQQVKLASLPTQGSPQINDLQQHSKSVIESGVLLSSLIQSRQVWLTSMFSKFSSKSRAKDAQPIEQPKHFLTSLGKCTLIIGPHIFAETKVFEVTYVLDIDGKATGKVTKAMALGKGKRPAAASPQFKQKEKTEDGEEKGASKTNGNTLSSLMSKKEPPTTSSSTARNPSTEISAQNTNLIAQLNAAAAVNPLLAQILTLAAQGKASTAQLQALTAYIHATTSRQQQPSQQQQQSQPKPQEQSKTTKKKASRKKKSESGTEMMIMTTATEGTTTTSISSAKETTPGPHELKPDDKTDIEIPGKRDVIFEFRENGNDRWLFPEDAIIESTTLLEPHDVVASFYVPSDSITTPLNNSPQQPVTMHLTGVSDRLWKALQAATNEIDLVRESFQDKMRYIANRVYLQYRIPTEVPAPLENLLNERAARQAIGKDDTPVLYRTMSKRKSEDNSSVTPKVKRLKGEKKNAQDDPKKCLYCETRNTPMWRKGPKGPGTLCNACGVKWRHGKIYNGTDDQDIPLGTPLKQVVKPNLPGKKKTKSTKDDGEEEENEKVEIHSKIDQVDGDVIPVLSISFAKNAHYQTPKCAVMMSKESVVISLRASETAVEGGENVERDHTQNETVSISRKDFSKVDVGETEEGLVVAKFDMKISVSKFGKQLLSPERGETLLTFRCRPKLDDGRDLRPLLEQWMPAVGL